MSGANYNVSVAELLESEKKLKIVNLLSLASSKSGFLRITDMNTSSLDDVENSLVNSHDIFDGIFDDVINQDLSIRQRYQSLGVYCWSRSLHCSKEA